MYVHDTVYIGTFVHVNKNMSKLVSGTCMAVLAASRIIIRGGRGGMKYTM